MVAPLACHARPAGVDAAADDQPPADAGPHYHPKDRMIAASRPQGRLGQRKAVGVVLDEDPAPDCPFQVAPERPSGKAPRVAVCNGLGSRQLRAGRAHADGRGGGGVRLGLGKGLAGQRCDRIDDALVCTAAGAVGAGVVVRPRRRRRRRDPPAPDDLQGAPAPAAGGDNGLYLCPAQIDADAVHGRMPAAP